MITPLLGVASSVIRVSKKLRKSPCARADGANSKIAAIAAATGPPGARHHLPIQDPLSLAQVKKIRLISKMVSMARPQGLQPL
jgi:hypothetical protein